MDSDAFCDLKHLLGILGLIGLIIIAVTDRTCGESLTVSRGGGPVRVTIGYWSGFEYSNTPD